MVNHLLAKMNLILRYLSYILGISCLIRETESPSPDDIYGFSDDYSKLRMGVNSNHNFIATLLLRESVNDVIKKLDSLGKRMGSMETKIGNIETKIGLIETNIGRMNLKMLNMESRTISTEAEIGNIKTKLDVLTSLPNSMEKYLNKHEGRSISWQLAKPSDNSTTQFPLLQELFGNAVENHFEKFYQFSSCYERSQALDLSENGVYKIFPFDDKIKSNRRSVNAYCDMETDGGGWTVFQRRGVHGKLTETYRSGLFNKTWAKYKNGFGDPNFDSWLGLEAIHVLTKDCNHELLISATELNGTFYQARYARFSVSSEETKFKLAISDYIKQKSTMADNFYYHNGQSFSTIDRDNDNDLGDCSSKYKANGFWFKNCFHVNLNGMYPSIDRPSTLSRDNWEGIVWASSFATSTMLKFKRTEMKIRPNC